MPPDLQIRPYHEADFDAVCALDALCFPPAIAYSPDEIAWFLSRRGAICFVAESPAGVISWILGEARPGSKGGLGIGHIVTIDVHPEYRRRGIGASLMDTLENDFRRLGCARVRLEVATDNPGAQTFYLRRGYATLRALRHYYADGSDALLMERAL